MTVGGLGSALGRLGIGFCLAAGLIVGAVALPFILAGNRASYAEETGSGSSCLLNALTGGPRTVTFSAWSWQLLLNGKRGAAFRVRAVDGFGLRTGHCLNAWMDHQRRGLLPPS